MSLNVVLTDDFTQDLDLQLEWYREQRDEELGLAYIRAVDQTMRELAEHPTLGTQCRFRPERLAGLRRRVVNKPFQSNLVFYRVEGNDLIGFRAISGWRDIPRRLLDPPGAL
ncbi:MAG TPA: type II toxin-antitoxin system RelE/ParE family toxin [Chthoniobacteraceae bacterium]|jgi:plasmid stabilization system protein ParE|nr:type II toxin-antitoxin system RelE/ParE family toxin [Chthoniobacteraceae bacterium]